MCSLNQTLAILGLDSKDVAADDAMTYFRWRHGLECARPVKKAFVPYSESMKGRGQFVYHSRRLCYGTFDSNGVGMIDLETGEISEWIDEMDEVEAQEFHYWDFFLSESYLVMMRQGRYEASFQSFLSLPESSNGSFGRHPPALWTVWNIHTSQRRVRELPCFPERLWIVKDKMVIFGSTVEPPFPIYIWDLSEDQIRKIGDFGDVWLWHMDAHENVLVTFEIDRNKRPLEVHQTKLTLTGQLLDKKHFSLSVSGRGLDDSKLIKDIRPFGRKTVTRLISMDEDVMMELMYDHAVDKLSFRWIDHLLPPKTTELSRLCEMLTPHVSYQWNSDLNGFHVCNTANGTSSMHSYQADIREVTPSEKQPFGDREVVGLVSPDGIQLWFFNPNFAPDFPKQFAFRAMEESG